MRDNYALMDLKDPIGTAEAATILRVSERYVKRMAQEGNLPVAHRVGKPTSTRFTYLFERTVVVAKANERIASAEAKIKADRAAVKAAS